jgi:hypothetical protein
MIVASCVGFVIERLPRGSLLRPNKLNVLSQLASSSATPWQTATIPLVYAGEEAGWEGWHSRCFYDVRP